MLAAATPEQQKQMIGERLFPLVAKLQPELAGKITGGWELCCLVLQQSQQWGSQVASSHELRA
jgi:hypothetical protein